MTAKKTKVGNHRFKILAMLVFATTINYFDRSIIGAMAPVLEKMFNWSNSDYAYIMIAFKIAYALGMLTMGGIIDKMGTRKGYTLAIGIWSLFGMSHALIVQEINIFNISVTSVGLFAIARFGLGFGESGHFPAAQKTVAEWFPKKDRAFATGLFNAATAIGAIAAPFTVSWLVDDITGAGWQIPFLITGGLSTVWVILWLKVYKKPEDSKKLSKTELDYITQDSEPESNEKIAWAKVLPKRQTWAFATAKITDAVWWFYLFWGAKYLTSTFGISIKDIGLPFLVMYLLADFGSISGGWISGYFMNKGWTVNKARKMTLLICAIIVLPVCYVAYAENQWVAIVLIGIAAAGHQAWSANAFTLVSDVFPKKAVASVTGIGGMVGAVAGIISDKALGDILDSAGTNGYFWAFLIAGSCYLVILGVVHLIMPKMTPLDENLELTKE